MKATDLDPIDFVRWAVDKHVSSFASVTDPRDPHVKAGVARLRRAVASTHAVVFDAAASARVGEISALEPEVLLHLMQSAWLPWRSCLVSVDKLAFWGAAHPDNPLGKVERDDEQYLFLLEQVGDAPWRIRVTPLPICRDRDRLQDHRIGILLEPFGFEIHTGPDRTGPSRDTACCRALRPVVQEYIFERKLVLDGMEASDQETTRAVALAILHNRDALDVLNLGRMFVPRASGDPEIWGAASIANLDKFLAHPDPWDVHDSRIRVELGRRMAPIDCPFGPFFHLMPMLEKEPALSRVLAMIVAESIGTPRIALAVITALGISGASTFEADRPRGARMVGPSRTPYLARSTVRIDINRLPIPVSRGQERGLGSARRRHGVRGHWVYYRATGDAWCPHTWATRPVRAGREEDPKKQSCSRCGAKRTWRRDHERGSAAEGFRTHVGFDVTASRNRWRSALDSAP